MAIGPILPGRLPNALAASRLSKNVEANKFALQDYEDQITTGHQFQTIGQSPAKALRTIVLQRNLERKQQFVSNVQTDRSLLNATEDALTTVGDSLNTAKSLLLQGMSSGTNDTEREALANEVSSLMKGITTAGNTKFRGRFLFGGSESGQVPFDFVGSGQVRYRGDAQSVDSFLDYDIKLTNNIDGVTAFNALSTVKGNDLNVALTLDTHIADLHRGEGVELGVIKVVADDGATPVTADVDLSGAETLDDIKKRIEDAFAATTNPVTVDIEPTLQQGLRISATSGTISIVDVAGSRVASDLGIASNAATSIEGRDLDPRLTLKTSLLSLNGGTGIGPTSGTGLSITVGSRTQVIDISGAETVEDLFNTLKLSGLDLDVGFTTDGSGLAISSRVSAVPFSIGENNGQNATMLGIRTLTANVSLSALNQGIGVPMDGGSTIAITRRDGSEVSVDLAGANTVQDVLDRINVVDPGNLTASLNPVGNGIALYDNSGAGALTVADGAVAESLGIVGSETGSDPSVPLAGKDINSQQSDGVFSILGQLEAALRKGDVRDLGRLNGKLDEEANRFFTLRGTVGTRQRSLDEAENRLNDEQILINEGLSENFDIDLAEVITAYQTRQQSLQATYEVVSRTMNLNLMAFL